MAAGSAVVSGLAVDGIDPGHLFRGLYRVDFEIDHSVVVVASHQYALQRVVRGGVDLLALSSPQVRSWSLFSGAAGWGRRHR